MPIEFHNYSKQYFQHALQCGQILILRNGEIMKPNIDIECKNQDLMLHITHRHETPIIGEPKIIKTNIIIKPQQNQTFEPFNLYVCYKPASIPMQPSSHYYYNTMSNLIEFNGINRLDRVVQGYVLGCLKENSWQNRIIQQLILDKNNFLKLYISEQEQINEQDKIYLVYAPITQQKQSLTTNWSYCCYQEEILSEQKFEKYKLKNNVLQFNYNIQEPIQQVAYKLLELNQDTSKNKSALTLIIQIKNTKLNLCWPLTGRTHQLRLHLSYIHKPISDDMIYNDNKDEIQKSLMIFDRKDRQSEFNEEIIKKQLIQQLKQLKDIKNIKFDQIQELKLNVNDFICPICQELIDGQQYINYPLYYDKNRWKLHCNLVCQQMSMKLSNFYYEVKGSGYWYGDLPQYAEQYKQQIDEKLAFLRQIFSFYKLLINENLLDEITRNILIKNINEEIFNEFYGNTMLIDQTKEIEEQEQIYDQLKQGPFKLFVGIQNNIELHTSDEIEDLMQKYYPEENDYNQLLSMIFYLNFKEINQSLSQIDKQQMKRCAISILKMIESLKQNDDLTSNYTEQQKQLILNISELYASFQLANSIQYIEQSIKIQKDFIENILQIIYDVQDEETINLILNTGLLCFTKNQLNIILAKNYVQDGINEEAAKILVNIQSKKQNYISLLLTLGQKHIQEAITLCKYEIDKLLNEEQQKQIQSLYASDLKIYNLDTINMQQFKFKVPEQWQWLKQLDKQFIDYLILLGELQSSGQLQLLSICLTMRNARPFRDLGCYYMTEISNQKQKEMSVEQQALCITNAAYLLMCAYKIDPTDYACRENLGSLLILTRSQLDQALMIYKSLVEEKQDKVEYNQNIGIIYSLQQNDQAAIYYYLQALKNQYRENIDLLVQTMQCLNKIYKQTKQLKIEQISFVLNKTISMFRTYTKNHQKDDQDKKNIFIQNFIYSMNDYVPELFIALSELKNKNNAAFKFGGQLCDQWCSFLADYANTEAGDGSLGRMLQIKDHFKSE